jgi:hypothetical protein
MNSSTITCPYMLFSFVLADLFQLPLRRHVAATQHLHNNILRTSPFYAHLHLPVNNKLSGILKRL